MRYPLAAMLTLLAMAAATADLQAITRAGSIVAYFTSEETANVQNPILQHVAHRGSGRRETYADSSSLQHVAHRGSGRREIYADPSSPVTT